MTARHRAAVAFLLALAGCGPGDGERRPFRQHAPNGSVLAEGEEVYVDGEWRIDGPAVYFREDGSQRAAGAHALGIETGPWTEWLADGSRAEGEYVEGQRHGEWTYWHSNGEIQEQGRYERGLREGSWIWWYAHRAKRSEALYRQGKLNGPSTYWKPDGAVDDELSGLYKDGERVGN